MGVENVMLPETDVGRLMMFVSIQTVNLQKRCNCKHQGHSVNRLLMFLMKRWSALEVTDNPDGAGKNQFKPSLCQPAVLWSQGSICKRTRAIFQIANLHNLIMSSWFLKGLFKLLACYTNLEADSLSGSRAHGSVRLYDWWYVKTGDTTATAVLAVSWWTAAVRVIYPAKCRVSKRRTEQTKKSKHTSKHISGCCQFISLH